MDWLIETLPVALLFVAAFFAARPNPKRVMVASWLVATLATIVGIAIPAATLAMWVIQAGMSAGTSGTQLSISMILWMLLPAPYYLWAAVTIAPLKRPSPLRAWHLGMHFGYALFYILVRAYTMSSVMEASGVCTIIVFWYRLVEAQGSSSTVQSTAVGTPAGGG